MDELSCRCAEARNMQLATTRPAKRVCVEERSDKLPFAIRRLPHYNSGRTICLEMRP